MRTGEERRGEERERERESEREGGRDRYRGIKKEEKDRTEEKGQRVDGGPRDRRSNLTCERQRGGGENGRGAQGGESCLGGWNTENKRRALRGERE